MCAVSFYIIEENKIFSTEKDIPVWGKGNIAQICMDFAV
jgi:hypothetical protein